MRARLKIIYWIGLSFAVFIVHDPRFVLTVLTVHLILIPVLRIPPSDAIRPVMRLKYFFLFLVVVQAVFPPGAHFLHEWMAVHVPDLWHRLTETPALVLASRNGWAVGVCTGFYQSLQITTMVLLTTVVRKSGSGDEFVQGLRGVLVPKTSTRIITACLERLESNPRRPKMNTHVDRQSDEKAPTPPRGKWSLIRSALRGDVDWMIDRINNQIDIGDDPGERSVTDRDVETLTKITFALMSLRMLKLTPGTGLTPGHQNLVVIPLLCLAASRTHQRWAATLVGGSVGTLTVMLGLGRNGVFILPAHVLPGIVIDLFWLKDRHRSPSRGSCILLGAVAGFGRFAGMLCVLLLLDNPELLAAVPFLSLGHVVFGMAGGAIAHALASRLASSTARDQSASG